MKIKGFISVFLMLFSLLAKAQSPLAQFNQAKEQYDNNNLSACISSLKSIEDTYGPSPKETSLLTYAYYDSGDYINAQITLHKYLKLVPYSNSEAHQSLLDLGKDLDQKIENLDQSFKADIQQKRMQAADQAISTVYNTPEKHAAQTYFAQQQQKVKEKQTEEEAFQHVVYENSAQAAQDFYDEYPNSFHRDEVIDIWQRAFLRDASYLHNEEALTKLVEFKQTFKNSRYYPQAKEMYSKKWNETLADYKDKLATAKQRVGKRTGRAIGNALLFGAMGFGLGYFIDNQNVGTGAIVGAVPFLMGLSDPNGRKTKYLKQDIKDYKEKIDSIHKSV